MSSRYKYSFILLLLFFGCKESFEPNLPSIPQGYLVVEGFINAQGSTQIKLSRTTPLDQKKTFKAELNAQIKIEGDNNSSFTLSNLPNGMYVSNTLSLDASRKYRLRIKTKDAKEYLSDFSEVKIAPPIDSINWKQESDGVRIYVNTHDLQNKTIYYRWDWDETWEIQSAYPALYRLVRVDQNTNERIIRETTANDPQIFYCWKYDTVKNIILGSSAKLDEDIIYAQPVHFIPRMDERLGIRYSVQVKQYALDKNGYQFYEQMKKNTESLGTIFDPQPSALRGNIHCVSNPEEIVIGYVNVTSVEQARIFISEVQLTGRGFEIYQMCESKDVANHKDSLQAASVPTNWPYEAIFAMGSTIFPPPIIAYKVSSANCVDCTTRGGKNIKPSFW